MNEILQSILRGYLPIFGWNSREQRIVITAWLFFETYAPWHWTQQSSEYKAAYLAAHFARRGWVK